MDEYTESYGAEEMYALDGELIRLRAEVERLTALLVTATARVNEMEAAFTDAMTALRLGRKLDDQAFPPSEFAATFQEYISSLHRAEAVAARVVQPDPAKG